RRTDGTTRTQARARDADGCGRLRRAPASGAYERDLFVVVRHGCVHIPEQGRQLFALAARLIELLDPSACLALGIDVRALVEAQLPERRCEVLLGFGVAALAVEDFAQGILRSRDAPGGCIGALPAIHGGGEDCFCIRELAATKKGFAEVMLCRGTILVVWRQARRVQIAGKEEQ